MRYGFVLAFFIFALMDTHGGHYTWAVFDILLFNYNLAFIVVKELRED